MAIIIEWTGGGGRCRSGNDEPGRGSRGEEGGGGRGPFPGEQVQGAGIREDSPLNKFLLNWADVICIRACGTDLSNVLSLRWRRLLPRGSDHSTLKGWTLTSSKIGCRHDLHDTNTHEDEDMVIGCRNTGRHTQAWRLRRPSWRRGQHLNCFVS